MTNFFTKLFLKLRQTSFFRVTQRTLIMLSSIAIIGSFFELLRRSVFSPDSLIYNVFDLDNLPNKIWAAGNYLSAGISKAIFGMFGLFAAYFAALYTARLYHKDSKMAGMTGIISLLFIAFRLPPQGQGGHAFNPFDPTLLSVNTLLIAILIGYGIGQVFHWLGVEYQPAGFEHVARIKQRAYQSLLPTTVGILLAVIVGLAGYLLQVKLLNSSTVNSFTARIQGTNNLLVSIPWTILLCFLNWSGLGRPMLSLATLTNSGAQTANLNFALEHGSSWQVPYKFLGSSLLQSYGLMGGASIGLALIIAIFLFSHNPADLWIAKLNLLPMAFNVSPGLFTALPIVLNPLYLIPQIFLPALNMLLAAGAIALNWLPVSAYPILNGTPGPLLPFLATNGSWIALIFTFFILALDVALLVPFVKLAGRINRELAILNQEEDAHAKI